MILSILWSIFSERKKNDVLVFDEQAIATFESQCPLLLTVLNIQFENLTLRCKCAIKSKCLFCPWVKEIANMYNIVYCAFVSSCYTYQLSTEREHNLYPDVHRLLLWYQSILGQGRLAGMLFFIETIKYIT